MMLGNTLMGLFYLGLAAIAFFFAWRPESIVDRRQRRLADLIGARATSWLVGLIGGCLILFALVYFTRALRA
jgi:hypothetical protein